MGYKLTQEDIKYNADFWVGASIANVGDEEMRRWWHDDYNQLERNAVKSNLKEILPDAEVTEENLNEMADLIEKILSEKYGEKGE